MNNGFDVCDIDNLPEQIAIFPLSGGVLLPRGHLPLNIFEPRYVQMIEDSFANNRLIGMVQPVQPRNCGTIDTYKTGCVGRIIYLEEAPNRRYLITLEGVCRFNIKEELDCTTSYRQVIADWQPFESDLIPKIEPVTNCDSFIRTLETYLAHIDMRCDKLEDMKSIPAEKLIATLAMICPFKNEEKQALLEAPGLRKRVEILLALMEMEIKKKSSHFNLRH